MAKRILIVEDDENLGKILGGRLRAAGFDVRWVPDAISAVGHAVEFKPRLIILDLMLPGGDGLGVLRHLNASVYTNLIPVMVLTGREEEDWKRQALSLGVVAYVLKPYDAKYVVEEAKKILNCPGQFSKELL